MATITIQLAEDVYLYLKSQAERDEVSVEQLASEVLARQGAAWRSERETGRDAARRFYAHYTSVFDRLAQ